MTRFVLLVGYSDSGKTTLMTSLIRIIKNRGYKVAAVKHAAHKYSMDRPGTDSWQYAEAGADQTIVVGPESYNITVRTNHPPCLAEILEQVKDVDIALVEGFKNEPGPKIEIYRFGHSPGRLPANDDIIAVVSDVQLEGDLKQFRFSQHEDLADFILNQP
ncbi:MAG: molybdopterin-guanine dinucleotide biosynthesis protein B [Syntrophomonadaceae bacterium]|nr:molybdopterin-guanine dinucleotide biosynthesis protein B [Syntrophomonadaceae bacterium]